jgi:hypothetical protein
MIHGNLEEGLPTFNFLTKLVVLSFHKGESAMIDASVDFEPASYDHGSNLRRD